MQLWKMYTAQIKRNLAIRLKDHNPNSKNRCDQTYFE